MRLLRPLGLLVIASKDRIFYRRVTIPIYQVDAFTLGPFSGNPAAVCPLDAWLDDATMQSIAAENNLSETALVVVCDEGYDLRWCDLPSFARVL